MRGLLYNTPCRHHGGEMRRVRARSVFIYILNVFIVGGLTFCILFLSPGSNTAAYASFKKTLSRLPGFLSGFAGTEYVANQSEEPFSRARLAEVSSEESLPDIEPLRSHDIWQLSRALERVYEVPAELIWAMVAVHSNFDSHVGERHGFVGVMGVPSFVLVEYGLEDINDPVENITAGAEYLQLQLELFDGDKRKAIQAFYGSPVLSEIVDSAHFKKELDQKINEILTFSELKTTT